MAESKCPPECHDKIETANENIRILFGMAIPVWVRGVFVCLLGLLFVLYAGLYAWAGGEFATKSEVKEIKAELRSDIHEIQAKLDVLLQRTAKP